jgi:hypothetical protein
MLKRIPKSDISIRPFKAYKEWSFNDNSAEISLLEAEEGNYTSMVSNIIITGSLSGSSYNKHSVYGQLRAQFYNDSGDNPFTRTGHKSPTYTSARLSKERFLSGSAKVISIPNVYVGEGIKKGSVILTDNFNQLNEISYFDDSFGNLQDDRDQINISRIDIGEEFPGTQPAIINFTDLSEYIYSASLETYIGAFDIQSGTLDIKINGQPQPTIQLVSLDIESGIAIAEDIPFLPKESQGIKIGNIFYNQGLIVLTRDSATKLQNDWKLDYKSTQTIYEHEYLLIVNEDEFNVSQNPTAVVEVGKETQRYITSDGKTMSVTTNPGTKYIKKKSILEDGTILDYRIPSSVKANISGGFEHYELSSSVDSTGSLLAPFITTIGLYDDNCDLVAVAKLPQPIKSEPDIPVNFIIRFDT